MPSLLNWPASQLWPLKQTCYRQGSHVGTPHGTSPVPRPRNKSSNADTCLHLKPDTSCQSACCATACRSSRFHGRENADQPPLLPPTGQNLFHTVFLPEVPLGMNPISIPASAAIFGAFSRI